MLSITKKLFKKKKMFIFRIDINLSFIDLTATESKNQSS